MRKLLLKRSRFSRSYYDHNRDCVEVWNIPYRISESPDDIGKFMRDIEKALSKYFSKKYKDKHIKPHATDFWPGSVIVHLTICPILTSD